MRELLGKDISDGHASWFCQSMATRDRKRNSEQKKQLRLWLEDVEQLINKKRRPHDLKPDYSKTTCRYAKENKVEGDYEIQGVCNAVLGLFVHSTVQTVEGQYSLIACQPTVAPKRFARNLQTHELNTSVTVIPYKLDPSQGECSEILPMEFDYSLCAATSSYANSSFTVEDIDHIISLVGLDTLGFKRSEDIDDPQYLLGWFLGSFTDAFNGLYTKNDWSMLLILLARHTWSDTWKEKLLTLDVPLCLFPPLAYLAFSNRNPLRLGFVTGDWLALENFVLITGGDKIQYKESFTRVSILKVQGPSLPLTYLRHYGDVLLEREQDRSMRSSLEDFMLDFLVERIRQAELGDEDKPVGTGFYTNKSYDANCRRDIEAALSRVSEAAKYNPHIQMILQSYEVGGKWGDFQKDDIAKKGLADHLFNLRFAEITKSPMHLRWIVSLLTSFTDLGSARKIMSLIKHEKGVSCVGQSSILSESLIAHILLCS